MSSTKIPDIRELREIILDLLAEEQLDDSEYQEMLDYALQLFDEQHLNSGYYGYHDSSHELVVTYNTLLAARGDEFKDFISNDDFKHLFAAALFHDYEPEKIQDKPYEELAANFVTSDQRLLNLFDDCQIDSNLVAILILRTSYPWNKFKDELEPSISKYFAQSKIADDKEKQDHYRTLGWFMSVTDRLGAYSLGSFLDAVELAKKNAHSLGWDPKYLIRRSISYFETLLNDEEEMTNKVLNSIPKFMRKTFMDNAVGFFRLREVELEVKNGIQHGEIKLVANYEKNIPDAELSQKLYDIFEEVPEPIQFKKKTFFESLEDPETILVTLRLNSADGEVVGFAKGGPLESYSLSSSINDKNYGKKNTLFLEPLAIKIGYWGQGGGRSMRNIFRQIAIERKFKFITSLQLREVIQNRIDRNENVEFVQQLNPERLDYYRVTL